MLSVCSLKNERSQHYAYSIRQATPLISDVAAILHVSNQNKHHNITRKGERCDGENRRVNGDMREYLEKIFGDGKRETDDESRSSWVYEATVVKRFLKNKKSSTVAELTRRVDRTVIDIVIKSYSESRARQYKGLIITANVLVYRVLPLPRGTDDVTGEHGGSVVRNSKALVIYSFLLNYEQTQRSVSSGYTSFLKVCTGEEGNFLFVPPHSSQKEMGDMKMKSMIPTKE
ncbi:hypothetical protein F2P81_018865 [Scophthalmus maximus]|uniref:Uncharacterized protein n=1 Tax=Scophthalmus maximus TaxID=52904 RepID=A0A6A4SD98_SCOMX|nr:hypothetical protein F2P81_018865 [Scophthalmus maximus]